MALRSIPPAIRCAALLLIAAGTSGIAQQQVELISVADTLIQENINSATSSLNRGTDPRLEVGTRSGRRQRMLVRFDLSSIPAGTEILSAELQLGRPSRANFTDPAYADVDKNTYAYRLLSGWAETEASWDWSQLNQIAWESPGAVGSTDRAAQHTGDGNDTELRYPRWDVTSDVQLSVDGTVEHFGWMMVGPEDEIIGSNTLVARFGTRESDLEGDRPTLIISYAADLNFESWREMHFTQEELDDPEISGPEAEPGGDGVPNLLKYAFGLAPREQPHAALPTSTRTGSELLLTYTQVKDLSDIETDAEVSFDLKTWSSGPEHIETVQVVDNQDDTETITVRAVSVDDTTPRAFLRVNTLLK